MIKFKAGQLRHNIAKLVVYLKEGFRDSGIMSSFHCAQHAGWGTRSALVPLLETVPASD